MITIYPKQMEQAEIDDVIDQDEVDIISLVWPEYIIHLRGELVGMGHSVYIDHNGEPTRPGFVYTADTKKEHDAIQNDVMSFWDFY